MALPTGTTAYYKMDGNANDAVSTNNGTATSVTFSTGNGKINQGGGFNGSSSRVTLPTFAYISGTAFSISAWFKSTAAGATAYQIAAADAPSGTGNRVFQLALNLNKVRFIRFGTSDNLITNISSTNNWNDGNWHLAVAIFDNTVGSSLYVDNTLEASDAVTTSNNTDTNVPFSIGANGSSSPSEIFNGAIDEVGFYNIALDSNDRDTLWNGGAGLQYPFSASFTPTPMLHHMAISGGLM